MKPTLKQMKLVMTLLVRDEADIVDAQIAFHLNAGVDYVVATDNRSRDGTTEILEAYARAGYLHLIREDGDDMRQGEWVTRMARLAATEFEADWVINADADEFYWPRGRNLKEVLTAIPARYGVVRSFVRAFLPRLEDEAFFAERMTVRLSPLAPIHDPSSIFRPGAKLVHRADARAALGHGTHALGGANLALLRGWYPLELLHFPFRNLQQAARKVVTAWEAWRRNPDREPSYYLTRAYAAFQDGRFADFFDSVAIGEAALEDGLAEGYLVLDTRVRDALRLLRRPAAEPTAFCIPTAGTSLDLKRPDLDDEVRYAVEAAALDEADVVRLQRRLDELDARLPALDGAPGARLRKRLFGPHRSRGDRGAVP